jgi:ubiquinone/menaquinone biosynthesis C-methylase UbiE
MLNKFKSFIRDYDIKNHFYQKFIKDNYKILDLGCGYGNTAVSIKMLYENIEYGGCDILPVNEQMKRNFLYQQVDLDEGVLPYPDNYFDIIIFTHVIEHLRYPLKIGKAINRVLKRGGALYIETPQWTSILVPSLGFHREQHNPFNFYDDHTHTKPWTKHGLYEFLSQSSGLNVYKVGTVRNYFRIPKNIFDILLGFMTGNRHKVISSFWNVYGWCIYGIGIKK